MKIINLTLKLSVILLFFCNILLGQDYNITWSELEKSNIEADKLLTLNQNEFIVVKDKGSINIYKKQQLLKSEKIPTSLEKNKLTFRKAVVLKDEIYLFYTSNKKKIKKVYLQKFDNSLNPIGKLNKLVEFEVNKDLTDFVEIIQSKNNKYFGLIYKTMNASLNKTSYNFKIFNDELSEVVQNNYTLPSEDKSSRRENDYLSDNGDYYISFFEKTKKHGENNAYHVALVTSTGLKDVTIDFKENTVYYSRISIDNNSKLNVSGIYGNLEDKILFGPNRVQNQSNYIRSEISNGATGVFNLKIDFDDVNNIKKNTYEFDEEFIMDDWKDRERANSPINKGKTPRLYDYFIKENIILKDGSSILTLEQIYKTTSVSKSTSSSGAPTTKTSSRYYKNDIIVCKTKPDGEFEWMVKIKKHQTSFGKNSPYSSFISFVKDDKINIVFNDDNENYNEKGDYTGPSTGVRFSTKKSSIAQTSINLNDGGVIKRNIISKSDKIDVLMQPQKTFIDYNFNKLLIYGNFRNQERCGVLVF